MRKPALATALSTVVLSTLLPLPAQAAPPPVWTHNAADRLFADTARPAGAPATIDLYAARNETEAAQIAVRPTASTGNVSVAVSNLTGPGGSTISDVTVRREYLHPNVTLADNWPPAAEREGTGSRYYDALVENTPRTLDANVTQPYHYSVRVPTGATPGLYTGTATVQSSAGNVVVPVRLTVYNATLPPTNQSTFKLNNWTTSAGWDYQGTIRAIPLQYGVQMYDANWWKVIEAMARNHARHRNNVVFADFQALLIPNTTIDAAGNYTFGWETFDRFIQIYRDAGALQWIHTPHLLMSSNPNTNPATPSKLEMLKRAADGSTQKVEVPSGSAEGTAYLNKLFPALKQHLDAKGLTDIFYMSANDETVHRADTDAANWMYDIYRRYFPNPKLNEAELAVLNPTANVTANTPILDLYENNIGHFQNKRLNGNELWIYNCISPRGTYLNRFIMSHLAKTRLTPLLAWKTEAVGYLHWGWNYWFHNDLHERFDTFDGAQNGDAFIVRPNRAAYDVYDSVRSEAQLDGVEDFELFTQLAKTKPVLAKALANSLLTNSYTMDRSGAAADAVHRQVLDALASGGPDQAYPYADDFAAGSQSWQATSGSWSASGGTLNQTATDGWNYVAGLEARAYGDVAASVDLQIKGVNSNGGNTNWAGLVVRNLNPTDLDSGYLVAQRNNGEVFVYRSGTTLGRAQAPGYTPGAVNRLRVIARGNKITVYAGTGSAPVLTVTDAAFKAGGVGLASGGVNVSFDNVRLNPEVNPAEGSAVTVSSSYDGDGWRPSTVVDGRRTSDPSSMGWTSAAAASATDQQSVKLDFGATRSISRIDLYPRTDGNNVGIGFPIDYTVQVSTDNANWTTVDTRTNQPRPNGPQSVSFAARDVRYIQVVGTKLGQDPFGTYRMQLAEIEGAGGNLAAGRPVTSSSSSEFANEGWLRVNLTDGARQSRLWNSMGWTSDAVPASDQWARVDLGAPTRISKVDLYARSDGGSTGGFFPIDYVVETSTDGVNFTPVATANDVPQPGAAAVSHSFATTTARYVQVRGTELRAESPGVHRMQLAELEVR